MPRAAPPQGRGRRVRTTKLASDQHSAERSTQRLVGISTVFTSSIRTVLLSVTCADRCRWESGQKREQKRPRVTP
jgi:hypothetical protein